MNKTITVGALLLSAIASNALAVDNSWYFDRTPSKPSDYQATSYEAPEKAEHTIWIDINMFSWHGQDHYYTEEPVYGQAHPMYDHLPKTQIVEHDFNEDNPGIFLRMEVHENFDFGAGVVKDSFEQTSWVVGVELHTKRSRGYSIGLLAGLAPAYSSAPVPQSPLILLPVAQFSVPGTPTIGVRIGYMPLGEVPYGVFQVTLGF